MGVPNWENRTLFHGDNLNFMRAMNSDSVHLIATDPPFNKGKDFHATPNSLAKGAKFQDRWSWDRDVHQEWVDQITDDFPKVMNVIQGSRNSYGDDMGAFLCFMAVRILEMHRILREDGSIYLHCDPTASHYLKELMDSIFGKKNFRNEIVWCYTSGGYSKRWFGKKHDIIFFYSKSNNYQFNPQFRPYSEGTLQRGLTQYKKQLNEDYELRKEGALQNDWWNDITPLLSPTQYERTGYPTQKPLALYERIIKASSNKSDIVLDPFAGCATTCLAAERLNRQWVGIDIWKTAQDVIIDRLEKEGIIAPKYTRRTAVARQTYIFSEDMHFTSHVPIRTDDGEEVVPFLKTKYKVQEPPGMKLSRAEMKSKLLDQFGSYCLGCGREFDDERYLEIDHNNPRSLGGLNYISNRILLCSPCNKVKSNSLTLAGLWKANKKLGYMVNSDVTKIKFGG